jgi:hypothetical protein
LKLFAALSSWLLLALNLVLFLLPGLAVTACVAARRACCAAQAVMLAIVASATLGYVAFWTYFGSRMAGRFLSFGVSAASIVVLAMALKRERAVRVLLQSISAPFAYVLLTGIFYSSLLFLFKDPFTTGAELANVRFFSGERPGDNLIPLIFAERIYARQPLRPFCCGDWLSSDRPPLQAGIFLFERPLKPFGNVRLNYELLGIGLECLWICGVWVLLDRLRAPPGRVKQVLAFVVFSGFVFYNSVYVWPKLLAASFVLFVFGILFEISIARRPVTWFEAVLAAISFALAILAHPGSIFSAPALLLLLIWNRRFLSAQKLIMAVLLIGIFAVPWVAYQNFYDPPGNRLLKMHLAGVGPIDSRSTWQAVRDTYRALDWKTIASYKWANVRTLIGPHPFLAGRSEQARIAQREYVWNALAVLNAGWIALAMALSRKLARPALAHSGLMIGLSLLNMLVWSMVLIGPGYTLTEHGAYADILLLSVGLLGYLLALPRLVIAALFVLQAVDFWIVWV